MMNEKTKTTIFLTNTFRYRGEIISECEDFLILDDIRSGKRITIAKKVIATREDDIE